MTIDSRTKPTMAVLGHGGMLGHMACARFRGEFRVVTTDVRYDDRVPGPYFEAVKELAPDVVVNAIGAIKQKVADPAHLDALNGWFPRLLRNALPASCLLIQPSTDCVFDGLRGGYLVSDVPNAVDAYGKSKADGESVQRQPNTYVVRTSIIGPERGGSAAGLLAWFLSRPRNAKVPGYVDHLWNGITTLEWTRFVGELVRNHITGACGMIQPCTVDVATKCDMLRLFAEVFRPDLIIEPVRSSQAIDRSLIPTHVMPPLRQQILELRDACLDRSV